MKLQHRSGETVTFFLSVVDGQGFDGSETVTCDVKINVNNSTVPPSEIPVIFSIMPQYTTAWGEIPSRWNFTITPEQSKACGQCSLITDAKIVFSDGSVNYPSPVVIELDGVVTA